MNEGILLNELQGPSKNSKRTVYYQQNKRGHARL